MAVSTSTKGLKLASPTVKNNKVDQLIRNYVGSINLKKLCYYFKQTKQWVYPY